MSTRTRLYGRNRPASVLRVFRKCCLAPARSSWRTSVALDSRERNGLQPRGAAPLPAWRAMLHPDSTPSRHQAAQQEAPVSRAAPFRIHAEPSSRARAAALAIQCRRAPCNWTRLEPFANAKHRLPPNELIQLLTRERRLTQKAWRHLHSFACGFFRLRHIESCSWVSKKRPVHGSFKRAICLLTALRNSPGSA